MCQYKKKNTSHVYCIYDLLGTEVILSGYKLNSYKPIGNIFIEALNKHVCSIKNEML